MYGKLAEQILDTLPERSFDEKTPIDVELEMCLRAVTTLDGLLDALLLLERVVGARVGLEFTRYRWTELLKDQADRLPMIRSEALPLYGAYRTVGAALRKTLEKGSGSKSKSKADSAAGPGHSRITVDAPEGYKGVDEFLTSVREFLVLSLWVSARLPAGKQLLAALAAQPQALMTIDLRPEARALQLARLCSARPRWRVRPAGHQRESGPRRWVRQGRADHQGDRVVVASWRAGVVATHEGPGPHAPNAVDVAPDLFVGYVTVEEALIRILLGSVSFLSEPGSLLHPAADRADARTHPRAAQRLRHEPGVRSAAQFEDVWTNAEEYWTIDGGPISENLFNAEVGLPRRAGHRGIPLDALDPNSEEAQGNSFATLSGSA